MKRTRPLLIAGLILSTGLMSIASAATTSFEVIVDPNPFKASEFVDVTIKALDADGNVDTTAASDVRVELVGFDATDPDVVIPGGGIGFFEPEVFGNLKFSKGLTVKKAGTYELKVTDVFDETIAGSVSIQVLADGAGPAVGSLDVTEPSNGSTLTTDTIDIVGSTTYPNTPMTVMIDGENVTDGLSDQQGGFIIPVTGLTPGSHTLQVNALDLDDQIVASSDTISFMVEIDMGSLLLGVELDPGDTVTIRDMVTFTVRTNEQLVDSVLLKIGEGTALPTTKESPGVFTKQVVMDTLGTFPVDVTTMIGATPTVFEDQKTVTVIDEVRKIIEVTAKNDVGQSRSNLQWTHEGLIEFFKVRYGTSRSNLRLSLTTNKPEGTLVLADKTIAYYAQVFPVDDKGITNGQPSDIIQIGPLEDPIPVCGNAILEDTEQCDDGNLLNDDGCDSACSIEPPKPVCGNKKIEEGEQCDDGNLTNTDGCDTTCQIEIPDPICGNATIEAGEQCDDGNLTNSDGCSSTCQIELPAHDSAPQQSSCFTDTIDLETMMVNGEYFITWDAVDKAVSYVVYRADTTVSQLNQMSVVARTTDTMFEYPFDPDSEVDKYAWYAVEAICENNDQKQIGNITAVKVGPEHTVLAILMLLILGLGVARTVVTTESGK